MAFDPNQTSNAYLPGEAEWARKSAAAANLAEAERLKNLNLDDNPNSQTPNIGAKSPATVNVPTTNTTGQKTGKSLVDQNFPGRRKDNPLSYYSSYTYSLTLYMVTPEFMNEFTDGPAAGTIPANRVKSNQIFVVAQSGGINNNVDSRAITFSKKNGPNEQGLDFFIDDLTYTTTLPQESKGQSTAVDIAFKITEPNGFTFLQDLTTASNNLNNISPIIKSQTTKPLALDQAYILSIRYYGYDSTGNLVQSKTGSANFSDPSAASERHLNIKITNVKFKLDEKSTIYSVTAANMGEHVAFSKSKGVVEQQTTVSGTTVKDALLGGPGAIGLLQVINGVNQEKKDNNKIVEVPIEYTIEFIGKDNPIANAKLIDDKAFESRISKMSSVSNTQQSNVSASYKAVTVNTTARNLSIAAGTTILTAIDNIIVKSDFVTSALNKVNTGSPESKTVSNAPIKPLQWYSINPVVTVKSMDTKTNTWSYKINFQIGVYNIPYARTPYAGSKVKYPGPFKYYGYFLTGENTEILEYEQTYDNLYALTVTKTTGESSATTAEIKKTGVPNYSAPPNDNPTGGKLGKGSEVNENVRAVLYSPGDKSTAKIKILGDPDYIMSVIGVNQNISQTSSASANAIYGPDNSINPFGGQVFIQIMFNLTTDYQNNGVMDISDKIQFYGTTAVSDAGIKGIVYKVGYVESSFSKGSFTQVLDCVLVEADQLITEDEKKPVERTSNSTTSTGTGVTNRPTSTAPGDFIAADARQSAENDKQDAYDVMSNPYSGLSDSKTTPSPAQANDDQDPVNRKNIDQIYTVPNDPTRSATENAQLQVQSNQASNRAAAALAPLSGTNRTSSNIRRF
jgi:hypothetical protein